MNFLRLPLLWSIIFLGLAFSLRAADATATLSVMSPEGAKILIDGKDRGVGPAILRELPSGKRLTVRVEMEGRPAVERDVSLTAGRIFVFDVDAPPEQPKAEKAAPAPKDGPTAGPARAVAGAAANAGEGGTAIVNVMAQDGATVLVDGAPAGYAPVILRNLPAGKPLVIRLELAGHEPLERSFTLSPGKRENLEVELQPLHPGFELTTLAGAEVVVINEQGKRVPIGFTDDKGIISSEGKVSGVSCTIEISKPGYEPTEQKVPLDPKNKTRLTINLRPKPARLQIVSVPTVSDVLVNGQKRPVGARGIVEVTPDADLTVEVKRDGYSAKSQKAKVGKGEEAVLNFGNLTPLSGGVKVQVVSERSPIDQDFHGKVRAFVDSREIPWNSGVLSGLTPGKHELMLMHELYSVVGEGGVTLEVKEGVVTEQIVKVDMKPARLRVFVQARGPDGKLFKAVGSLMIDGQMILTAAPDDTYDVPAGREFIVSFNAVFYTSAKKTFPKLAPGDEQVWEPVIELDKAASLGFEMSALLKANADKMAALRKISERGPTVVTEARQWIALQRQKYSDLEKRFTGVFVKSTQFEQDLAAIDKLAETLSQQPKNTTQVPSPF